MGAIFDKIEKISRISWLNSVYIKVRQIIIIIIIKCEGNNIINREVFYEE